MVKNLDSPIWFECIKCKERFDIEKSKKNLLQGLINNPPESVFYREKQRVGACDSPFYFEYLKSICCPSCKDDLELILSIVAKYYYEDDLSDFPFDIYLDMFSSKDLLITGYDFSLLLGEKIRQIITRFFQRWAYLGGHIYFITPFINRSDLLELISLYWTHEWLKGTKHFSVTLITRHWQGDFEIDPWWKKPKEIRTVHETLDWIFKEFIDRKTLLVTYNGENIFKEKPKVIPKGKKVNMFVTSKDFARFQRNVEIKAIDTKFHAKFYAAVLPDNSAEIIDSSYNFVESERSQYETFSFVRKNGKNFYSQIKKII